MASFYLFLLATTFSIIFEIFLVWRLVDNFSGYLIETTYTIKTTLLIEIWRSDYDLVPLCCPDYCVGPLYTFYPFDSGDNRTLVDNILLLPPFLEEKVVCQIVDNNKNPLTTY